MNIFRGILLFFLISCSLFFLISCSSFTTNESIYPINEFSIGETHICGTNNEGTVFCGGGNLYEQLKYYEPIQNVSCEKSTLCSNREWLNQPITLDNIHNISAGGFHTCGIRENKTVVCWGWDKAGQLDYPKDHQFKMISSGYLHTCGLDIDRFAVCWGGKADDIDIDFGQTQPPDIKFSTISAGGYHTCGIDENNTAHCWGATSESHPLIDFGQATPPKDIQLIAISSGMHHTCGLDIENNPVCWGDKTYNQINPPENEKYIQISSGHRFTCGIKKDNFAKCWGKNNNNQIQVPKKQFSYINLGPNYGCGKDMEGILICWGKNNTWANLFIHYTNTKKVFRGNNTY